MNLHFATHVRSRLVQLAREVDIAAACVAEAATMCQSLGTSPVNVLLPKVLRVPVGEYDRRIETPLGIAHWLLASTGDKMPQRLALRPASLHTVLALETALVGAHVSRIAAIVASMPFLTGDAER
jgi:NADH:ubiquinone oxidoreductase subunit D